MLSLLVLFILAITVIHLDAVFAFQSIITTHKSRSSHRILGGNSNVMLMASSSLGDYTVTLEKPLGIILEEREAGGKIIGGVQVKEISDRGSAALSSSDIVPGDVLLQVDEANVEQADFDTVMDTLLNAESPITLTLGDGLGIMDMPKNVVKQLKSQEDAFLIDEVVRQTVRVLRKRFIGQLGNLLKVEVIVGAGVTPIEEETKRKVMVRFFAIFSTDGVSTYSCNVSATGIVDDEEQEEEGDNQNKKIDIVSLSCAKDEGLGRTFDLI